MVDSEATANFVSVDFIQALLVEVMNVASP